MHPWHDVPLDATRLSEAFPVVIEIPRGSKNKYELDKASGLLRLDRVLYSAVHYPADYGFVPRTLGDDGDAVDALVLGQEPVVPMTIVMARAIGMLQMHDEAGRDEKLIAVSVFDPSFAHYRHFAELPKHVFAQIRRFFLDYKVLEQKQVEVQEMQGPDVALEVLRQGIDRYAEVEGELRGAR